VRFGYMSVACADGKVIGEAATVNCAHYGTPGCRTILTLHDVATGRRDATDIGGWCFRCAANVCGPCADQGTCTPFEKRVDRQEARHRMFAAMGIE
jgi:hypothetical protein